MDPPQAAAAAKIEAHINLAVGRLIASLIQCQFARESPKGAVTWQHSTFDQCDAELGYLRPTLLLSGDPAKVVIAAATS